MIIVAGKNNIAVWGLQRLIALAGKANVAVVLNKSDEGKNGWQKSLRYFADLWGVETLSLDEAQVCADIFISLEFDRLINPTQFKTKALFNIHFSLLPKYRGMYTSIWPLLNNESVSGVTLHEIDSGIDTGPIVDQEIFAINHAATSRDLYLLYTYSAVRLLNRNIGTILDGQIVSYRQSAINTSYYSKNSIKFSEREINLKKTAYEILKFIRSFCFREYQLPEFQGRPVVNAEILDSNSVKGFSDKASEFSVVVQAIDYPVRLYFDCLNLLIEACERDDVNKVHSLIKNIVSIDDMSSKGWTPLMVAAYHNAFNVARCLIKFGADINARNHNGTTVLMYAKDGALRTCDNSTFEFLLSLGSDMFARDYSEKSIFDYVTSDELSKLGLNKFLLG